MAISSLIRLPRMMKRGLDPFTRQTTRVLYSRI